MFEEKSEGAQNYNALPSDVFLEQAREKWTANYNHVEKELKAIGSQAKKEDTFGLTVKGEN